MEKQVFKEVWLPLSDSFYRVAYSMLGTEADARDAVQDLYIRLWNARHNLDTVSSPLPYGIRVIRNICIDRIRLRSARGESQDVESVKENRLQELGIQAGADRVMIDREMLGILGRTLDSLPENQRKVMEMRFFRQLDYDEIVEKTGLSAINVRVLVNRARKTVIAAMKEYLYGN